MTTVELLSTALAILSTTGGGLWVGFKAIMAELKDQTKTLALLGERSNGFQIAFDEQKKETRREIAKLDQRVGTLEDQARRESGIRSVTVDRAVQDVAKTLETKTNGGTEYPNRTSDYGKHR